MTPSLILGVHEDGRAQDPVLAWQFVHKVRQEWVLAPVVQEVCVRLGLKVPSDLPFESGPEGLREELLEGFLHVEEEAVHPDRPTVDVFEGSTLEDDLGEAQRRDVAGVESAGSPSCYGSSEHRCGHATQQGI
ncbi:hypothetical protein RB200_04415 [Streptomyces sp. PmtG]